MKVIGVLLLALPLLAQQAPRDAIGTVVVQPGVGPRPFVLIAVDAFGEGGRNDGAVDYVYKFYTSEAAPDIHYSFDVAHIDDLGGQLIISAPNENMRITFANRGEEVSTRNVTGSTEYVYRDGIGISRMWGDSMHEAHIRHVGASMHVEGPHIDD